MCVCVCVLLEGGRGADAEVIDRGNGAHCILMFSPERAIKAARARWTQTLNFSFVVKSDDKKAQLKR